MTTDALASPHVLARSIETAWRAHLERTRRAQVPHAYVYASAWRVCDRRMVLELTDPDQLCRR